MKKYNKLMLIFGTLSLVGCGSILSPQKLPQVNEYEIINLNQASLTESSCENIKGISLFLPPARGVVPYDSYKMYYTDNKYKINAYGYNEWITTPADMIGRVAFKNIITDCQFKNSVTSVSTANAQYKVITTLDILRNESTDGKMNAHLAMTLTLVDNQQNSTVAIMHYDKLMPTDGTPAGYVDVVNQLVNDFSIQAIAWLKANVQQSN